MQVPASHIGHRAHAIDEHRILPEVISLSIFVPCQPIQRQESLEPDYLSAGLCLLGAVFSIFRNRLG